MPPDDVAGAGDGDLTSDKKRKKETNMKSKLVEHPKRAGEMITVFEGRTAAEDSRWILITALKPNSTKDCLCLACGKAFTGYDGRVV